MLNQRKPEYRGMGESEVLPWLLRKISCRRREWSLSTTSYSPSEEGVKLRRLKTLQALEQGTQNKETSDESQN